ncbi:2Fe-2S iron-sulfur cluster-binding protein, partial [Falsiroseomonas sp.]|uniref:2Fe-2S iron-sulfur cluster-binding protein n=1 Tax=Falsiroseomonas sp. TaxID=2870721 RepID=UPI0027264B62
MTEIVMGSLFVTVLVLAMAAVLLAARSRLLPQGVVKVSVNGGSPIEAARGDQLLSVLHEAGIAIPAACGGTGTCGLCRVTVEGE